MRKTRLALAAAVVTALVAAPGAQAQVTTGDQTVTAAAASTLALGVSTPLVTLTPLTPGGSSTGTGAVAVTSTNPWSLSVADATNGGRLAKVGADPVCPASAASLTANPLTVASTGLLGTTISAGLKTIDADGELVANGVFTDTLTNNYSIAVNATESLSTGCAYTTIATYTVQSS